jgi:hypothetical protein
MTAVKTGNHRPLNPADVVVATVPYARAQDELDVWAEALVLAGVTGNDPAKWGAYLAEAPDHVGKVHVAVGKHNGEPVRGVPAAVRPKVREIRARAQDGADG